MDTLDQKHYRLFSKRLTALEAKLEELIDLVGVKGKGYFKAEGTLGNLDNRIVQLERFVIKLSEDCNEQGLEHRNEKSH